MFYFSGVPSEGCNLGGARSVEQHYFLQLSVCANAPQSCCHSVQTHNYQRFTEIKHSIALKCRG